MEDPPATLSPCLASALRDAEAAGWVRADPPVVQHAADEPKKTVPRGCGGRTEPTRPPGRVPWFS